MVELLGRWTSSLVVLGLSPPLCYSSDLLSVAQVELLGCAL